MTIPSLHRNVKEKAREDIKGELRSELENLFM